MPQLRVEYAKSGRAKCSSTTCNMTIAKNEVRVGTAVLFPAAGNGGGEPTLTYKWRHVCCFTDRQLKNALAEGGMDSIEGLDDLAPTDRDLIAQMMRGELFERTDLIGRVGDVVKTSVGGRKARDTTSTSSKDKSATKRKREDVIPVEPGASRPFVKNVQASKLLLEDSQGSGDGGIANEGDVSDSATEEFDVSVESTRPPCPYGDKCFRNSVHHMAEYSHGPELDKANPPRLRAVIKRAK
ncbi:Poly(ADP ribose) polymerase and DNA Ligase Zn finger region Zinc finger (CX5CX6HX5H) motif [Trypanosoma vivax]|uniref:PARP-type domain-containing protein n=1 Tax=Trypanosoma vivax (strain Y486) TaxID=1055687 RepID=G0U6U8_TRYVY|nr:hypothetical protein TRVL_02162 [Trypanosoma vivax]KAH8611639.1 Poly(ADP ribose) polymerase and DNA Ligase Zn finger region Zinc finger (CX5CX6HX5H) motif [Trypanosoma vivax]CCC51603.1 conserved hypothetical protein [Trypanosoma vivax Y486]